MIASSRLMVVLAAMLLTFAGGAPALAQADGFLLLDRSLQTRPVRVVEIGQSAIMYRDASGELQTIQADRCIALTRARPEPTEMTERSLLVASDGQRLPGTLAVSAQADGDMVMWGHRWLGQIRVPLDRIAAVTFEREATAPVTGETDALVLRNGDRLDGFIEALADPISVSVTLDGQSSTVAIPLERAASVALVTPPRAPVGRRVWFADGTVLDVSRLVLSDDGFVRFTTSMTSPGGQPVERHVGEVNAVLFDAGVMVPLRRLTPVTIESSVPRYVVPAPVELDEQAPLDLGRIEYRGPITVRYALPEGARRFAARVEMPRAARAWGDFDLVLRDDEREVFRARLNEDEPATEISVALEGSELTIELTQGENGPIQDRAVFSRAMILVK